MAPEVEDHDPGLKDGPTQIGLDVASENPMVYALRGAVPSALRGQPVEFTWCFRVQIHVFQLLELLDARVPFPTPRLRGCRYALVAAMGDEVSRENAWD